MAKKGAGRHKNKSGRKKTAQKSSWFARVFKFGFLAAIWGGIALLIVCAYFYITLPGVTDVQQIERNAGVEVYDREDRRIARFGQTRGETVLVDQIPRSLKQAVIAIEDRRFYDHFGIDVIGITRAMFVNVRKGAYVQGGSTITQQLAKNLFLKPEKTINRKIQEAMLALWLESQLSKDEIITAYLNRVYFGSGAYGITAAAHRYYNKTPDLLNVSESAQLAAALKAPSRVNPVAAPTESAARATLVLNQMQDLGFLTEAEKQQAVDQLQMRTRRSLALAADSIPYYFTDWVLDQVGQYTAMVPDGMSIYTAHDRGLYEMARGHIDSFFENSAAERNIGQVAVVLMEYDGTIRLMIGGKSYAESQFNRATQARRQPGSAFKTVVYLAGLEKGHRPDTLVYDAPFESGSYRPTNYGGEYYGEIPFNEAFARSLNTAAVRIAEDAGMSSVTRTARDLGIESPVKLELASALGASEVRLIELVTAYAVIANGGRAVYPNTIERLQTRNNEVIYQRSDNVFGPRVFSNATIRNMKQMLRDVPQFGTGRAAYIEGVREQGGKTGTSQSHRDAYYIGYADGYVMGVWMGNDDNSPMTGVTGGSEPARLWRAIMRDALNSRPVEIKSTTDASSGWGGMGGFGRMLQNLTGAGHDQRAISPSDDHDNQAPAPPQFEYND